MKTVHVKKLRDYDAATVMPVFKKLLSVASINSLVAKEQKRFYRRIFTPVVLLWCLIYQRLSKDHSQDEVVVHVKSGAADHLSPDPAKPISQQIKSESTAAYSNGCQRFPLAVLKTALTDTAKAVQQTLPSWHGHPAALLDGTIFVVRPTPELIEEYGTQSNQHGTNYWVQIRGVGAFCLQSGVLIAFADASIKTSEQALAVKTIAELDENTVLVGDINFGVFFVVQAVRHQHCHAVFRLSQVRAKKIVGRGLRPDDDVIVAWSPSPQDQLNNSMSTEPIAGRVLCYRLQCKGFRPKKIFLFTTLLKQKIYTADELLQLYGWRLHVELNLRYVKEQLEMRILKGKSPDSVRKELYSGLLAYNLIRACMAEAATAAKTSPLKLSFTRCWRRLRLELLKLRATDSPEYIAAIFQRLLLRLQKCKLPERKLPRFEPRAVRTRPRPYAVLKGDRKQARKHYIKKLKAQAAQKC
jgi:hypothetical protein